MQARRIVVVAHKFHTTAEDELVAYLNLRGAPEVLNVRHSFSDAPDRRSAYRLYRRGTLVAEGATRDFAGLPEPLIYLKELWFTAWWILWFGGRWDRYIAVDGLLSFFGLLLRAVGAVRLVSYWCLDFVPEQRFASGLKNAIYRWINRYASLHADEMWDHTELMVTSKRELLGLTPESYRAHFIVPYGIWVDRIRRYHYEACEQHTLVFVGHMLEKQGVQLVLRAIPEIVRTIPDFRFRVIGTGEYRPDLDRLVEELGVQPWVEFTGRIESDLEMEDALARSAAAIAPYIKELDTFTQFGADPGKVKNYLGCGLPVLITDVPWIARALAERGCGELIEDNPASIAAAVVRWLTDAERNQAARDAALEYALTFDNARLYDALPL
ncbi:MAG: glycosyltransferase [Dehalococcoidia bacterium]